MASEIVTAGPIRKFADENIQASIDSAIKTLQSGQHGAVIAYADFNEVKLAAVAKLDEHWSVVGVLDKPYKGKLEGQAAVRFTW